MRGTAGVGGLHAPNALARLLATRVLPTGLGIHRPRIVEILRSSAPIDVLRLASPTGWTFKVRVVGTHRVFDGVEETHRAPFQEGARTESGQDNVDSP
jgi:hypothetical protein